MKKKILAVVMSIFAAVLLVAAFAGCSDDAQAAGAGTSTTASVTLNKKYIEANDISEPESEQTYFIFTSDDTGLYHYFNSVEYPSGGGIVNSYSIHFRYKIVSDMVYCFYDSVEYDEVDTGNTEVETDWTRRLCGDTDFLVTVGSDYFFNENYLGEIPHFGK